MLIPRLRALAAELPGDVAAANQTGDRPAALALNHRPPWDEGELVGVFNEGEFAGGELQGLLEGPVDACAVLDGPESSCSTARLLHE